MTGSGKESRHLVHVCGPAGVPSPWVTVVAAVEGTPEDGSKVGECEGPGVEAGRVCLDGPSTQETLSAGVAAALPNSGFSFRSAGGLRCVACSLPRAPLIQCLKEARWSWWWAAASCNREMPV
ncbi:hypothetical protein E2C01_082607 [Portunus trituberculatus]|uniref:Uncharacterized protein n=1 Tax=Portunus trituberculatus TaxID=210409 RepID=A0A5B7IYW9_PORTR|nr:hypothetical protein [Portunus trituberculatus]